MKQSAPSPTGREEPRRPGGAPLGLRPSSTLHSLLLWPLPSVATSPSTNSQRGQCQELQGKGVETEARGGEVTIQSRQFLSPLPPIRGSSSPDPQPLTSRSQRDRRCSRGPWALMGPGRRWGGTQRETRSHQGLGGGCWLSQRPSWGPTLARGTD